MFSLRLSGDIGRYNQNMLNSGALGESSLTLDLTAIPTSSGTTAAMAGQTFNFQAWFRTRLPGFPNQVCRRTPHQPCARLSHVWC